PGANAAANHANMLLGTSSSSNQFETYTRNIQLIHSTANASFARFQVNGALQATLSGAISGGTAGATGFLFTSGQGNLVLSGSNSYQGLTIVSGQSGMLTLANNNALGNTSGVTFTVANGKNTLGFQNGV